VKREEGKKAYRIQRADKGYTMEKRMCGWGCQMRGKNKRRKN